MNQVSNLGNIDEGHPPTYKKLISWYFNLLGSYPAFVGQLSFYLLYIAVLNLIIALGLGDAQIRAIFPFAGFFDIFYDVQNIVFFIIVLSASIGINQVVLNLVPRLRASSRGVLLLSSLIIGAVVIWPVSIFAIFIVLGFLTPK